MKKPILFACAASLLTLCSFLPQGASARERGTEALDVAERYLKAYSDMDLERLAPFWTERSVWQDPTGGEIGASTEPVVGREAIVAHLKGATAGIKEMKMELPERFTSGGQVVSIGTFSYVLDGRTIGPDQGDIAFAMKTVIILSVEDGKVLRHTDYADFSTWIEQFNAGRRPR